MANAKDHYARIIDALYKFIEEAGGSVTFDKLVEWAEENDVGIITLSIALNDLIEEGKISAPEGFFEPEDYVIALPVPRVVTLSKSEVVEEKIEAPEESELQVSSTESVAAEAHIESFEGSSEAGEVEAVKIKQAVEEFEESVSDDDLEKAIEYLNDYWSVGVIRFFEDLKMLGVSKPDRILRKLLELGFVTYSTMGVVNATEKLPKLKRSRRLSEFI